MLTQLSKQFFQEFNKALSGSTEALPQKELRVAAEAALRRLNLVTREEFDAQSAVLLRTREKVEALEAELAEMEQQLRSLQDT